MRLNAAALCSLVFPLAAGAALASEGWLTKFVEAQTASKEANKPILADFISSDADGASAKLKKEVLDTDEFKAWAEKNVVLLELDFPKKAEQSDETKEQNQELKERFGVETFPTILFLDAEGKELGRSGYVAGGPQAWIEKAEAAMRPAPQASEGEWLTSWDEAVAKAKKEKKLILADFTGSDWCSWCIKLKAQVFTKPEFIAWADANVVLLELDFPRNKPQSEEIKAQNEELRKKHNVGGYPTILFLDTKGKKKGQMGYDGGEPKAWIEKAAKIAGNKKGKKVATGG